MYVSPLYYSLVIICSFIYIYFHIFVIYSFSFFFSLLPFYSSFFQSYVFIHLFFIFGSFQPNSSIHVKSKILKSLKYSPFDSLIENRKLPKFQLHSPHAVQILRPFQGFSLLNLSTNCDLEHFQGTIKCLKT